MLINSPSIFSRWFHLRMLLKYYSMEPRSISIVIGRRVLHGPVCIQRHSVTFLLGGRVKISIRILDYHTLLMPRATSYIC